MVEEGGGNRSEPYRPTVDRPSLSALLPPERVEYELVVAHPSSEWLSTTAFDELFDSASIELSHLEVPEVDRERLFLFHDGAVVTSSPVSAVTETIAAVNEMILSGTATLDSIELPSVLVELDEVPFAAAGPDDSRLKLLFITISRYIETRAFEADDGTLRVGFQRLSRLRQDQEGHTRSVYEQLADSDVSVHGYGRPDWVPPASLSMTIHGGYTENFRAHWFLVFGSPDEEFEVAFLARDHGPGAWRGFWTFQPDRVAQINEYLEERL